MPNTITSKTSISALRAADVFGADQASNSNITAKVSSEQIREYIDVGSGSLLPKFNAKVAKVKAGTATSNVLVVIPGDSTTIGKGSGTTTNLPANSWPTVLQKLLLAANVPTSRSSFFGRGDGTLLPDDSRVVIGSSWNTGAANSLGGQMYNATTTTNALSFTPTEQVDTFDVYYATIPSAGTFSLDVNGAGTVTQNSGTTNGIAKKTITATLGYNTLNIKYSSGGTSGVFISGVIAYNSAVKCVMIVNAGWGGATTANVSDAVAAYGPLNTLKFLAPDLTIPATCINDWLGLVTIGTFNTNYQSIITAGLISGDVLSLITVPSIIGQQTLANQLIYVNAIRALAISNGIPLVDIFDRFQSFEISNPLGLYFDNIHPNAAGYDVMGKAVFDMLNVRGSVNTNIGIIDGTNAAAGIIGEIITSTIAIGSATSLTTATDKTITSITLQPGDYDIWGNIGFIAAAGTIPTVIIGSVNTTTNTQATSPNGGAFAQLAATLGTSGTSVLPVGAMQVNPAVVTTYYLVGTATFTVSTLTAYGSISARRRR